MSPLDAAEVPGKLHGLRVAVLVAGGIAAYKVADLVSQLTQSDVEVRVGMTHSAQRFVGAATFQALSGRPVLTDLWHGATEPEPHVSLGDWAQVVLVAPATANILARLAQGVATDVVTATVLASRAAVVVAPAMNDAMWGKPQVRDNVDRLREAGIAVVEPEAGHLASGHSGSGRLPSNQVLLDALAEAVAARYDLAGRRVVVSAGGTREPIDAVRFVSNYSSGKMGAALARAAAQRGADVVLVTTAPSDTGPGVRLCAVETAAQMLDALRHEVPGADLLAMAAAVADFRPHTRVAQKIHREERAELLLELERNVDILAELAGVPNAEGVFRLGFAAEAGDAEARAREKLARKRLDAIVANDITRPGIGFGSDDNEGVMLLRDGTSVALPRSSKREMADRILDVVAPRLRVR